MNQSIQALEVLEIINKLDRIKLSMYRYLPRKIV